MKPTEEHQQQIAMMASQIFGAGQHSVKWAVRYARKIWEETAEQLKPENAEQE
jgi:protoheme ferro-lyase